MKVLVLAPALYGTSPGQRFRIEQWAHHLEPDGFRFTYAPFEDEPLHRVLYQRASFVPKAGLMAKALGRRLVLLPRVKDFDLVYLFREASLIGPAIIESLIARHGIPIVYDFDDPIWLPYRSPTNGVLARLKCTAKTASICRLARDVIVGNRLLARWARRHARRVHIIPSTIELDNYPLKPAGDEHAVVTLGWTGSHSTLPFLHNLWKVLQKLAVQHRFALVVISHTETPSLPSLSAPVIAKRWQAATEARDLHPIDVGLAPFPDSGWTPWRCHGKVLQYMAAGIPTVASRIGILPDYIQDGATGFLASSEEEWIARLSLLIRDVALRRRLGLAARQRVEEHYSARGWAPRVRHILEAAADRHCRLPQ
jgi:glycosyltransferase involved in cell wall biosynthesis